MLILHDFLDEFRFFFGYYVSFNSHRMRAIVASAINEAIITVSPIALIIGSDEYAIARANIGARKTIVLVQSVIPKKVTSLISCSPD